MRLKSTEHLQASGHQLTPEPRYDSETLRRVAALAQRLQTRQQETLTASEMEAIGVEVGLKPSFIREALAHLTAPKPEKPLVEPGLARKIVGCWWAAGWSIIPLAGLVSKSIHAGGDLPALAVFLYVVPGIVLSILLGDSAQGSRRRWHRRWEDRTEVLPSSTVLSRADLLAMLFALQGQLEGQKQRRAFLSVDVVDSSAMKQNGPELAVEYSFGNFRRWVEGVVRESGGGMQSAAGDGMMCLFPTDAGAVRAARRLQEGLAEFNATQNRLALPFRIRCGVSAGEVAIEEGMPLGDVHSPVIDRAAALQKQAEPGDILVSSEVAAAGLIELGNLAPLPEPIAGAPAFSWRAGQQGARRAPP